MEWVKMDYGAFIILTIVFCWWLWHYVKKRRGGDDE